LSDLKLVVAEIRRIWTWALPYHSVCRYDEAGRTRILAERREMVAALRIGDVERLVGLMDAHRAGSADRLNLMLEAGTMTHPPVGRSDEPVVRPLGGTSATILDPVS